MSGNPSGAVEGETTARHHAVNMGMMLEVLTPRVQDAEQSNVSSQVAGVAGDLKECRGTGAEEQVVEQPLVLQHQCGQLMGQSEDDVEVRHGQQLGGTRCQPSGACVALTLGAVPVAARVIGDGLMPAAGASIDNELLEDAANADATIQNSIAKALALALERPCKRTL